jgi:MFS transporter, SP family, arabinose:H+ symporter
LEKGRVEEARGILVSLEGEEAADKETTAIQESIGSETGKFSQLFAPGMRMALLVAVALAVFQQTTGASTLLLYAPSVFKAVALMKDQAVHQVSLAAQNQSALQQAIVVNVCLVLFTILAVTVVDKLGRRPMLLFGAIAMAIGQILMGVLFHFKLPLNIPYAVVFVVIAVAAYTVSFAPLAWLVMAEIFPTRIRARAMAVATFTLQMAAQVASGLFPAVSKYSKDHLGSEGPTFWLFAAICGIAFLFCLKFVPETKGRTLEEISASWTKRKAV